MTTQSNRHSARPTSRRRGAGPLAERERRTNVASSSRRAIETALADDRTRRFVLRLYVTGTTPASLRATEQVRQICEEHLRGRYELEVIDIYQLKALARDHQIVATPTLIKVLPEPLRRFVGDLSKVESILFGLDLREPEPRAGRARNLRVENARIAAENESMRHRLDEVESSLAAIRSGEAESLVVEGPNGPRIFSREGVERAYRVLVEAMNEGAATVGEDQTILYCNARFAEMLACPLPQVMGSPLMRFLPPSSERLVAGLLAQASTGESRGEVELVAASGEVVPAYLSVSLLRDELSRRFCLVATDLRAQKRNEEIVRAERLARAVLEQAAEIIVVCDAAGRIVRASRSAAELCTTPEILVRFEDAFPLRLLDLAGQESAATRALRGQLLRAVPATLACPGKPAAEILLSANPIHGPSERVIGCVVMMVDVTEHRHAERALRRTKETLEDVDRRRNEFLAMLSHELRNPLTPIKYGLEILRQAVPGSGRALRAQEVIERQVNQLTRLVDDLLDLTRITRGKTRLQLEMVPLCELAQRTVEEHRGVFEAGHVDLDVSVPTKELYVNGDRTRLAQALGNLLQNAAKFTPAGGRTSVSVETDEGWAVLRVADTGQGISGEMLPRLFEPFSQADTSLDRRKGGLGLGLAVVKSLVEMHGGSVTATSGGVGKGSTFALRLPLAADAPRPFETQSSAEESMARRRILIVEDNVDAADTLRELLDAQGHEIAVANSGRAGLAAVRAFRPQVVLCDIGLPEMDGYEVARSIRELTDIDQPHLVALTGYARPEDVARAKAAGFEEHLAKPPSLEAIEAALARTLGPR